MVKLNRQRKRKKFKYTTDRQKVRQRAEKNLKFNVKVDCDILKASWDNRKSLKANMSALGVAADPNSKVKSGKLKFVAMDLSEDVEETPKEKTEAVQKLEKVAAVKKPPTFRFSLEQVKFISSMMDKHKFNFKAMSRDPNNHYQETPRNLQHKVRKFMSIPDHYVPYCRERGLLESVQLKDDAEQTDISDD